MAWSATSRRGGNPFLPPIEGGCEAARGAPGAGAAAIHVAASHQGPADRQGAVERTIVGEEAFEDLAIYPDRGEVFLGFLPPLEKDGVVPLR